MWCVGGVIFGIGVAVFGLSALGSTVESDFTSIESADSVVQPATPQSLPLAENPIDEEPVTPAESATPEEATPVEPQALVEQEPAAAPAPALGEAFGAETGFTISRPPEWVNPDFSNINSGEDVVTFAVPSVHSGDFETLIRIFRVETGPDVPSAAEIIETHSGGLTVEAASISESIEQDGEVLTTATLNAELDLATAEAGELPFNAVPMSRMVIHRGENAYVAAVLTSAVDVHEEAVVTFVEQLDSVRVLPDNDVLATGGPEEELAQDTPAVSAPVAPQYVSPNGAFSILPSTEWELLGVNEFAGTEFNIFAVPELSTTEFEADVLVWDIGGRGPESTYETIFRAESVISELDIVSTQLIEMPDGEEIAVGLMSGERDGVDLAKYMVIHKTETAWAAAVLTGPVETLTAGVSRYEASLQSLRYTGSG